MDFDRQQTTFQSHSQWYIWRLGLDLAPLSELSPQDPAPKARLALHRFFSGLLEDLYTHPQAYALPETPYEAYLEPRQRLEIDKVKSERIRQARLKARVAIDTGILDFLYQLGQAGTLEGAALHLDRPAFDALAAEKVKKTHNKNFLAGLEHAGLHFTGEDVTVITCPGNPEMVTGLSCLAKACANVPEIGFYFFRRCDFGACSGKRLPALEDALRLASGQHREAILQIDALLAQRKFKRQILVADAGGGYRLRYNKKNDQVVYWCRLMSWSAGDFNHNLRWKFESDLTPRLFARLDEIRPGLAQRVFSGIKRCEHDYENCIARVVIEHRGVTAECCSEDAWNDIGESAADFENLQWVLSTLDDLLATH